MNRRTITFLLGAVLLGAGCSTSGGFHAWQVDPLVKIFPDDPPGARQAGESEWLIARNGHATVQIAVRSDQEIPELSVELSPPESDGTALQAGVRWAGYVPVGSNPPSTPYDEVARDAPALFPDPLFEEIPFRLTAGRTQPIWITIYCPPGTAPGLYEGEAAISAAGAVVARVPYSIRVAAVSVPAEQTLQVTNWFNLGAGNLARFYDVEPYSDKYWELLGNIGSVMASHGQNVMLTPISSLIEPRLNGAAIRYDFSRFDRWVETFERAGLLGTIEGGHLLGRAAGFFSPIRIPAWVIEHGRVVRLQLPPDDPRAERFLRGFLTSLYAHLKQKGWEGRYLQHIHDEPHAREAPVYNRYARIVRECLPGVPTIDAVSLDQDTSFFADVCDIWVPVLGSFDHKLELIADHKAAGGQSWFYTCIFPQGRYLNRFIDYSLLKVRLLHWMNFRYHFTGFLHWGGNYWGPKPFANVQSVINVNRTLLPAGDNAIVYPNPKGNSVFSSIRLEAMRDGIEDYELLHKLAETNPESARELVTQLIPHMNDYTRDPVEFRRVRRLLFEALAAEEVTR